MIHLNELLVQDVMTEAPLCLRQDTPLAEAYTQLVGEGIHGAPVLDGEQEAVGVVSVTDLLLALAPTLDPKAEADAAALEAAKRTAIGELLDDVLVTCKRTTRLVTAAQRMIRARVHRLVVVEDRRAVGVVSAIDVVRAVACLAEKRRAAPEDPDAVMS